MTHMPMELINDQLLTKAADVFSFGVLLYEVRAAPCCARRALSGLCLAPPRCPRPCPAAAAARSRAPSDVRAPPLQRAWACPRAPSHLPCPALLQMLAGHRAWAGRNTTQILYARTIAQQKLEVPCGCPPGLRVRREGAEAW